MRRSIRVPLWGFLFLSFLSANRDAFAVTTVGFSSATLESISSRHPLGMHVAFSKSPESPVRGLSLQRSVELHYFPVVNLADSSHTILENDQVKIREENKLEFDDDKAGLLDLSPRAELCALQASMCVGLAPLAFSLFFSHQDFRAYVSPSASLRGQYHTEDGRRWYALVETKIMIREWLLSVGASL